MRPRALTTIIFMLIASGCTETSVPAEASASSRETTPGGFTSVSYRSVPNGPVYEFEVVVEIGRRDDVVFGRVADIELTDTNDILILDVQSSEIRRFDAFGREGERVAGPGQGPGELGRVNGFSVDRLGSIWVVDWGNLRMHEFPASIDYIDEAPYFKLSQDPHPLQRSPNQLRQEYLNIPASKRSSLPRFG